MNKIKIVIVIDKTIEIDRRKAIQLLSSQMKGWLFKILLKSRRY